MATVANKRPATKSTTRRAKVPAKRRPKAEPFLRFYHSGALRKKTLAILSNVEEATDCTAYRGALAEVVVELTDSGMDYYYLRALKVAGAGFLARQSASVGIAGTTRLMAAVIRNIMGGMDDHQVRALCGHIRHLMD